MHAYILSPFEPVCSKTTRQPRGYAMMRQFIFPARIETRRGSDETLRPVLSFFILLHHTYENSTIVSDMITYSSTTNTLYSIVEAYSQHPPHTHYVLCLILLNILKVRSISLTRVVVPTAVLLVVPLLLSLRTTSLHRALSCCTAFVSYASPIRVAASHRNISTFGKA